MAEIPSDQDHVYDATQSTLVTLKELSTIAVALKIWHCEINKYRTNDELEKFSPEKLQISLKAKNPDLPTTIDTMIRKYVSELALSIDNWLKEHHKRALSFHYGHRNYILEDFDDFVWDYEGDIDYTKTAERMMRCDKFGDVEKFKIACTYFLEDDIRRIWPSIRKKIGLDCINFRDCPELYYWICCLTNELNKIPITDDAGNSTVDEEMLDHCMPYNRSSVEYFWNRVPYGKLVRKAWRLDMREIVNFIKFILPKCDHHQFDELVNKHSGWYLMQDLLQVEHRCVNEKLIGQAWMRLRNIINAHNFVKLVVGMFKFYERRVMYSSDKQYSENWLCLCREIWHSAPHGLRRSAIDEISYLFYRAINNRDFSFDFEALLTALTCATFEERSLFWERCWRDLIERKYTSTKELQQMMETCFENGDAIIQYKEDVMATCEYVQLHCDVLLFESDFDKLNDFVNFCFPNEDTARPFKQKILKSNFLRKIPVFLETYFGQATQFNKFINDAYNNTTRATNFKNNLLSLPVIRCFTPKWWGLCSQISWSKQLTAFMEFIETFASTERQLKKIKMLVIDHWKENGFIVDYASKFTRGCSRSLDQFLLWCLGSDEEAGKFKQAYTLRWYSRIDARYFDKRRFAGFHDFLLWCLGSDEEVVKFKKAHIGGPVTLASMFYYPFE
ncbi:uncharacterized protein LOC135848253 isoform X4 [Planococcus citri]|uniref:uncharacterized protein LOC135848253 isoform X4 n=1 Tax=Planococcus citri TaxID=170843 RepID=UPI0031FA1370